jgi:RecJ-like exonuclease
MITAKRLKEGKTVQHLRASDIYVAVYKEGSLHLNGIVRATTREPLREGKSYAVRISKITLPSTIAVDVIQDAFRITDDEAHDDYVAVLQKNAQPSLTKFTFSHPQLDLMHNAFITAATLIKSAVLTKTPIILRHHADCDGYAAALSLENALLPLLAKEHGDYAYRHYSRNPSRTPYYDYADATRDMEMALTNKDRYKHKDPLIILADIGSGEENLLSVSMATKLGAHILIIDHHDPGPLIDGKSALCKIATFHLNPFLHGSDSRFCTGILLYELSRFISGDDRKSIAPIIAAIADKVDKYDMDVFNHYQSFAEGYSLEFLQKLTRIIDYETQAIKFFDISTIIEGLFMRRDLQEGFINIISPEIEKKIQEFTRVIRKYAERHAYKNFDLTIIDADKCSFRGEYPSPGKITAIAHDEFLTKEKGLVTLGMLPGMIIFRCDNVPGFDVNNIISKVAHSIPFSLAEGGGHAAAGSMTFIAAASEEVIRKVRSIITSLDEQG